MRGAYRRIRRVVTTCLVALLFVTAGASATSLPAQAAGPLPIRWQHPIGLVNYTVARGNVFLYGVRAGKVTILAYRLADGALLRTYPLLHPALSEGAVPVYMRGRLYSAGTNDLEILDASSGKMISDTVLVRGVRAVILGNPVVNAGVVFIHAFTFSGKYSRFFAVDVNAGKVLWSRDTGANWVAMGKDVVLGNSALDGRTGRVLWSIPAQSGPGLRWLSAGGRLYEQSGAFHKEVTHAFSTSGTLLWTRPGFIAAGATGDLVWGIFRNHVVAVNAATGNIVVSKPGLSDTSVLGLAISAVANGKMYSVYRPRPGVAESVVALDAHGTVTRHMMPALYSKLQGSIQVAGRTLLVEAAVPGGAPFKLTALTLP